MEGHNPNIYPLTIPYYNIVASIFLRSRRVPVLKLGSRGPGGDARSLRLCPQAFASVRNRPQSFAIVRGASDLPERLAKRRTVVTFYVSRLKSVNSHRDRGGRGRETQNCRYFWTRLGSSRLKSVNSHRDRGGGSWSRNAELSSLLDSERGERREEKRRVDRRKERRGEWIEERREERGDRREERRGEERRGERR